MNNYTVTFDSGLLVHVQAANAREACQKACAILPNLETDGFFVKLEEN